MTDVVTAIEAYQSKAEAIAAVLASRIGGHYWDGYTADEKLEGQQISIDSVRYWRPKKGEGSGNITFGFIAPEEAQELDRTPPRIIKKGIEEIYAWTIDVLEGTTYDETLTHTFTKTVSESEALATNWHASVSASIGWAPPYATGGFKADLTVSAGGGQTRQHTSTEGSETTDTIARRFTFTGPKHTRVEARRSRNVEERTSNIGIQNSAKVYFYNGSSQYEWSTIELLISALKGHEPKNTDFTPYGGSSSIRQKMIDQPASKVELLLVQQESDQRFPMTFKYDDVTHQSIKEVAV